LIAEQVFSFNGTFLQRTISAGIAVFKSNEDTLDDLVSRADSALYHAKELGKNRVAVM
jgi:diguanylate cyclase (GGDEF)-like protein